MTEDLFSDFTPVQLDAARDLVRTAYGDSDPQGNLDDVQKIADLLQFSCDEVRWLLVH